MAKTKKHSDSTMGSGEPLPPPLVRAIAALDSDVRRAIVYEIDASESMAFTSIHKAVSISKQDLAAHLKVLVNAGLLYQKARKAPPDEKYSSYYCLTQFAVDLLKCLLVSLDTNRCKELLAPVESSAFHSPEWQPGSEKVLDKAAKTSSKKAS